MGKQNESITILVPKYGDETVLERFVSVFHQDFELFDRSPDEIATGVFRSLSVEEKVSLKNELIELLDKNPGKKQKGLLNSWFRLGAQWWDKRLDLRQSIENWVSKL